MMCPPKTYADWIALLALLKERGHDEEVLAAMREGSLSWQSGVAERFTAQLMNAVEVRLGAASDVFSRSMQHAREERETVAALLSLRRTLSFLLRAVDLPALPQEQREALRKMVAEHAERMQESLLDSARSDRTGRMMCIVRSHCVNRFDRSDL